MFWVFVAVTFVVASAIALFTVVLPALERQRRQCKNCKRGTLVVRHYPRPMSDEMKDLAAGAVFVAGLFMGVPLRMDGGASAEHYWVCNRCGQVGVPRPPHRLTVMVGNLLDLAEFAISVGIPILVIYLVYTFFSNLPPSDP